MATRFQFQRREAALVSQREERRHRIDGRWVAASGEEVAFAAMLTDISSFGCRLTNFPALEANAAIRLHLPGGEVVDATVIWVRDDTAGCRFLAPISQALMRSLLPGAV